MIQSLCWFLCSQLALASAAAASAIVATETKSSTDQSGFEARVVELEAQLCAVTQQLLELEQRAPPQSADSSASKSISHSDHPSVSTELTRRSENRSAIHMAGQSRTPMEQALWKERLRYKVLYLLMRQRYTTSARVAKEEEAL
jgi:hypothetical protein